MMTPIRILSVAALVCFILAWDISAAQEPESCSKALLSTNLDLRTFDVSSIGLFWGRFWNYDRFNYKNRKRVLLLGDGGRSSRLTRSPFPPMILSTDINARAKVDIVADNTALPFAPGIFDTIIMGSGICVCSYSTEKTCGGVKIDKLSIQKFLWDVVRLLDPTSPNSIAVLTGFKYRGTTAKELFISQAQEIQMLHPEFKVRVLVDPSIKSTGGGDLAINPDGFMGIAIHSRQSALDALLQELTKPADPPTAP